MYAILFSYLIGLAVYGPGFIQVVRYSVEWVGAVFTDATHGHHSANHKVTDIVFRKPDVVAGPHVGGTDTSILSTERIGFGHVDCVSCKRVLLFVNNIVWIVKIIQ